MTALKMGESSNLPATSSGFLGRIQTMETKTTSKGQITIPSNVRKELGIKDGTILHVDVPVTRAFVRSLRGKYKGMGLMKALMEEK